MTHAGRTLRAVSRKSYYDLSFGVASGGANKDAHYIRGTLDEVKADLAAELAEGMNLYLLCWYGADLTLDVYQHGDLAASIDLHPFIAIEVEGYPRIIFTGPGKPVGHDFDSDEERSVDDGSLSDLFFMGAVEEVTTVTVDWAGVAVPALLGDVAQPGDLVSLGARSGDAGTDDEDYVPYGFTDFEG